MTRCLRAGLVFLAIATSGSTAYAQRFEFDYTGSLVTFKVPIDGGYQITAFGAQGGNGHGASGDIGPGGKGAGVSGSFDLTAGEMLQIAVGGMGVSGPPVHLPPNLDVGDNGGGGGGGSFVVGPNDTPLVIAGGGGGGGGANITNPGGTGPGVPGGDGLTTPGNGQGGTTNVMSINGGGGGEGFSALASPPSALVALPVEEAHSRV
jgi:hypothetical protein